LPAHARFQSTSAEPGREERLGILGHQTPAVQALAQLLELAQTRRRRRRGDVLERLEHRVDVAVAPRRRPARVAEVFEHEQRPLAVVPADELRQERRRNYAVDAVLVSQPPGGELVERVLDETRRRSASSTRHVAVFSA
jgi:hypothetical protein